MDQVPALDAILAASAATPGFRADVATYAAHRPAARIHVAQFAPRVKVLRLLAQLLHAAPSLAVARVRIDGWAGCADFRGALHVEDDAGATQRWRFWWDCRWAAAEAGWTDALGFPDQSRAARELGWRCFREWAPLDADEPDVGTVRSALEQRA